ncbi:MAG: hypothetical protein KBD90_02855 [Alphaproteobacteria bacterium]|nr:hypothetical protein [Alphaproteobacteria bacterium]
MNKNQKQDSLQEMLNSLKGDYNFPAKLWVWSSDPGQGYYRGSHIPAYRIVHHIFDERRKLKS